MIKNRALLKQLISQDIRTRYSGSILGLLWLVLIPLLTLTLYSLVFGTFMKARWGGATAVSDFALVLFPGLIVFNLFSECVNRAPALISANPNYVKKVVFPLILLPVVPLFNALLQFLIGMIIWAIMCVFLNGAVTWRVLLVPFFIAPFVLLILGISWILSSLGVYVRDLISLIPLLSQVLMFLSPVLYPLDNLSPAARQWLFLNPLTFMVETIRNVLLFDRWPVASSFLIYFAICSAITFAGYWIFRILRPGFADVV
jgi:lipopolysaccharide transport system permease protein